MDGLGRRPSSAGRCVRRRGPRGAFDAADPEGADWIEPTVRIGPAALGVAALDAPRFATDTVPGPSESGMATHATVRVVAKSDPTGRARLREAASELFAEHGFAATSTRSTAAAAGLSPVLATWHFGSKQGQRAAVDEYVLDRIGEQLRDLDSVQPDRGPMVSLGEVSARVLGADPVPRGYLRRALLEDSAASAELVGRLLASCPSWAWRCRNPSARSADEKVMAMGALSTFGSSIPV